LIASFDLLIYCLFIASFVLFIPSGMTILVQDLEKLGELGSGQNGTVVKAFLKSKSQIVALKVRFLFCFVKSVQ
jgi:hypothetical protein